MNHKILLSRKKSGNILFLILLAVVLFAALSYAVTSSMRGGGKDASTENAQTAAAGMVQYATDVSTFITRAQLMDNVKDTEFTFQVSPTASSTQNFLFADGTYNGWNYNSNCIRAACRVFKPYNPDGIAAQTFEKYAEATYLTNVSNSLTKGGHSGFQQVILQNVGTSAPDLLLIIWGLRPDICNAINAQMGLTTNYNATITIDDIGETAGTSRPAGMSSTYTGPTVFDTTRTFGDQATQFAGMRTFCAPMINGGNGVGSRLSLVHVLIER